MTRTPGAIWVVDTNKEHIAVAEARKLNIPVISILDTNCDPDLVDYKIPGNDDAIRSINLLTRVIADAVAEGLMARAGARGEGAPGEELAGDEPLADWERELYLQADVSAAAGADQAAAAEVAAEAPVTASVDAPSAAVAPAAEEAVLTADPVEAAAADEVPAEAPSGDSAAAPAADASPAEATAGDEATTTDETTTA
jgi:small subunit ribosomal protein S2